MAGHGRKAILAALLANLGIAVAKLIGFLVTRSASMLAEGVHSVADASNQGLLLWGGRQAERPPTPQHPFGYGRERYFWAFVVAIVLFTLGAAFAVYEGIEKIRHPHDVKSLGWAMGILCFGIVLETGSFRTAIREARPLKGRSSWWSFIRRAKSPEIPVVLLEDAGALVGLVVALAAVVLASTTGDPVWDGIGTLTIGVLLGIIAVVMIVEMKSLLIGESASARNQQQIREVIESHPSVVTVLHMRTMHVGPDEILLGAKVDFGARKSAAQVSAAINEVEAGVRAKVPACRLIYIEPDLATSEASPIQSPPGPS